MVRNPILKNLSIARNWNTGNTISYNFKPGGFVSSTGESPLGLAFAEPSGIICLPGLGCCPWNRTSSAKPHKNRNSSGSNSTMLYPDTVAFADSFSMACLVPLISRFIGTASSASACKITGQVSSKHGCNFDETKGDWIPSRKGFHCK